MNKKICSGCKIEKNFKEYNKCKSGRLGLHNHCRLCQKLCKRKYYLKNLDKEKQKSKEYQKTPKAKLQRDKYYVENKDFLLDKNRKRRTTPKARKLANIARKKLLERNPSFKLGQKIKSKIRYAVKNKINTKEIQKLLGCSIYSFIVWIESLWKDNMDWSNYGKFGWHFDHIIPSSSFDLTKEEERLKCFHYTNTQPLWYKDNLSKGNK